jgi:hypothetical protein
LSSQNELKVRYLNSKIAQKKRAPPYWLFNDATRVVPNSLSCLAHDSTFSGMLSNCTYWTLFFWQTCDPIGTHAGSAGDIQLGLAGLHKITFKITIRLVHF